MIPTDGRAGCARRRTGQWVLALLCAVSAQACGGLTVTPTSPTSVDSPGVPLTINFRGTLADGGSFDGFLTYGGRDIDDRPGFGRYRGGTWQVNVHGGSTTQDVTFSSERGGRAAIETYRTPFPAIGIVFLWPEADPAVESLTPHLTPNAGYDPDVQPAVRDFGGLIPGQFERAFGVFDDGRGGRSLITAFALQ